MRIKETFAVFRVVLLLGMAGLMGVSLARSPETISGSHPEETAAAAVALESLSEALPEGNGEANLAGLAITLGETARSDMILASYRDEATRDWVLGFIGDIMGSRELAAILLDTASIFDISPALACALCWEESRYNPRAVNRKNQNNTIDRGLFQLNSASFPGLKESDFFSPSINTYYGLSHLCWCLETGGTEVAALAMYNAGVTRVSSGETPKNTLDYISRILVEERRIEELFLAGCIQRAEAAEPVMVLSFASTRR